MSLEGAVKCCFGTEAYVGRDLRGLNGGVGQRKRRVRMMNADAVVEVLAALENASVQVWLDGGWGVDALLGEQTRGHTDPLDSQSGPPDELRVSESS